VPERQALALLATNVEDVGILEDALVAVRRADQERDARAPGNLAAVDLHRAGGGAGDQLRGGVVAQRLLHPARNQRRVVAHALPLVGVLPQPVDGVPEQLGGGLVAGDDHEEEEGDDVPVAEAVAVDLGGQQGVGEVVLGARAVRFHVPGEVAEDVGRCLHSLRRHLCPALLAVNHGVGPGPQRVAVFARHSDHLADHVHGELAGELLDEVAAPGLGEGVQIVHRQGPDVGLEVGDAAGCEAPAHQAPEPVVARRVHGQERHDRGGFLHLLALERHALGVGEAQRVAKSREHVRVSRQGPEIAFFVVVHGGLVAQGPVHGVGVFLGLPVVGIEVDQARLLGRAGPCNIPFACCVQCRVV
jgi:hypothetical protein